MNIAIGITALLLLLMTFLATVDMAFGQLSDVGLRRLITEAEEERPEARATSFLKEILEDRPRFRFTLSAMIQILLVAVTVLVTSISRLLFSETRFLLIAFVAAPAGSGTDAVTVRRVHARAGSDSRRESRRTGEPIRAAM